jgi:hypothetical protein
MAQAPLEGVIQVKDLVAMLLKEDQDADVCVTMFDITGWLNRFGGIKHGSYKASASSSEPGRQRRFVGLDTSRYDGCLADLEDDATQEKS